MEQELLILSEHLSSPPVFCWVRVTRSLVFCVCVCFVDGTLSFCPFCVDHCVVCPSIQVFPCRCIRDNIKHISNMHLNKLVYNVL